MHQVPKPAFIGCDWGSSNFRLALLDTDASVIAEHTNAGGIVTLRKSGSDIAGLLAHLRRGLDVLEKASSLDFTTLPLIISGMAGSSIGICEIPYLSLPFTLDGRGITLYKTEKLEGIGNQAYIIPGVCSDDDVMRGEETEAMGLMADLSLNDALLILPGTHSKHLKVADGMVTSFKSYMTGELFDTLAHHTVLRKTLLDATEDPFDEHGMACFFDGLKMARSTDLMHELFTLRSRVLLDQIRIPGNIHRLSGLLIGTELLDSTIDLRNPVLVGGSDSLQKRYVMALQSLWSEVRILNIQRGKADHAVWRGQYFFFQNNRYMSSI